MDDLIEPVDLANMRANGMRSLEVQCHNCRLRVIVNVDHLPGDLTVPSFGPQMVCTTLVTRLRITDLGRLALAG
jgi:hypothetical protein